MWKNEEKKKLKKKPKERKETKRKKTSEDVLKLNKITMTSSLSLYDIIIQNFQIKLLGQYISF